MAIIKTSFKVQDNSHLTKTLGRGKSLLRCIKQIITNYPILLTSNQCN